MLGVTIILLVLFASNLPGYAEGGWRDLTGGKGVWTGNDNAWNLRLPNMNNAIWHYGPARLWTTPVNSDYYEITSRVKSTSNSACGHIFKYKTGSHRTQKMVTKAWGYFLWANAYMYITSNGKESSPRINYNYQTGRWYNLKTVVKGAQVKIYIDKKLVKLVTMTGSGATSKTKNYVGIWCHHKTFCKGQNFKVKNLRPGRPNNNPNNQLKCSANHMQIKIPKSSLPFMVAKDLRLNQPSCRATEDNKNFYLKTGFDQCGTTTSKTGTIITYSNHVLGRPLKNSAVISRIHDVNITMTCSYPRHKVLTSSYLQPNNTRYVSAFHSKGKFNYTLNLFPSSQFRSPYKKYPIKLHLRQVIYVEVAVKSVRKELSVLAQQCYATPSKNGRGALKHWLIKNGCAMDSTLKNLNSPTKNVQRFSVQAFHFLGKHRHVYFHCHVISCNGNDVKSVCSRGCNKKKIGKRNIESSAVMVTRGPITGKNMRKVK